jgi:uncharacterized protein (TIGR02246 family)
MEAAHMNDDERAIRNLVADWLAASRAGDHAKVLSLVADDVVFLIPGQPPMRGKTALRRVRRRSRIFASTASPTFRKSASSANGRTAGITSR